MPVEEYKDGHFVLMATKNGVVKKTALTAFEKRYAPGLRAINLDEGDKLIGTIITMVIIVPISLSPSSKLIALKPGAYRFSKAVSAVFFTTPFLVAISTK